MGNEKREGRFEDSKPRKKTKIRAKEGRLPTALDEKGQNELGAGRFESAQTSDGHV